jgi:hypothetical protein
MKALRRAWPAMTRRSGRPEARAAVMKSCRSTSTSAARISKVSVAVLKTVSIVTGRTMCHSPSSTALFSSSARVE